MIEIKTPDEVTEEEFARFRDMVRQGTESFPATLNELPERALFLAFSYGGNGSLIGTGGIKIPRPDHRQKVFTAARSLYDPNQIPLEIGWIRAVEGSKGEIITKSIVTSLLEKVPEAKIYSVFKGDNVELIAILKALKFRRSGVEIHSTRGDYFFLLFVKE